MFFFSCSTGIKQNYLTSAHAYNSQATARVEWKMDSLPKKKHANPGLSSSKEAVRLSLMITVMNFVNLFFCPCNKLTVHFVQSGQKSEPLRVVTLFENWNFFHVVSHISNLAEKTNQTL